MKFLCDRCKTRYSIGDDRVRGKILKIRCKNCANVITVREGMEVAESAEDAARRGRPTTAAPLSQVGKAISNPLGAAFASQMTKPPPALEEEWYVSIDGDQSGPFSLAEAQRWVAARPFDAELHCWSEGFDDWLPVDKVSHFRGLRKKPSAPAAPPPMPRVVSGRAAATAQPAGDDEPKPLFAATMASLEKGGGPDKGLGVPAIAAAPTARVSPVPSTARGIQAKANGSAVATPVPSSGAKAPAIPKTASTGGVPRVATALPGSARNATVQGVGTATAASSPGAKALAAAFDVQSEPDPEESLTAVASPSFIDGAADGRRGFGDEMPMRSEPRRALDRVDSNSDAAATMPTGLSSKSSGVPERAPSEDDGLDIGEVSRVVKLADLMGSQNARRTQRASLRGTGSAQAITGSAARVPLGELGLQAGDPAAAGRLPESVPGESMVVHPPVIVQRRGLIMLISVAALLVIGVIGAVVLIVVSNGDENPQGGLGHSPQYDFNRPEETGHRNPLLDPGPGSASTVKPQPQRHWPIGPNIQQPRGSNIEEPIDPLRKPLEAGEIEDMAAKQGEGTRRCYMRAQKGALGIEIGDIKKIGVTLIVDREGMVSDVQLSDHGADTFGKCLIARIKSWKFRASPGGTFRFALAFSSA